jgi:hypothetical protein
MIWQGLREATAPICCPEGVHVCLYCVAAWKCEHFVERSLHTGTRTVLMNMRVHFGKQLVLCGSGER